MRVKTPLFRLTAAMTTAALLLASTALVAPAVAQQPTQPFQTQPDQTAVDPPPRVGRLVATNGAVSYHASGDTAWTLASTNFPVASGNAYWTEQNAHAEMELSASRVGLAGGTELDVGTLDANGLQATLTQGEVLLRPRALEVGETWTLITPRGTVTTSHAGRIAVVAGDTASPTIVSVLEGEATVTGPGLSQTLRAGQAATIDGTDALSVSIGLAMPDAFVDAEQYRDRPPLPRPAFERAAPPPLAIADMPGGADLQAYGAWNQDQQYGQVWYPSVEPGWVPYRHGHWAFVQPWGWTWIDDAPWGFAPFHYGRWVELRGRWAWTPAFDRDRHDRYPTYAPALVTFIGIGVGVTIVAGHSPRDVGWVPLAPREPYRPWFHASQRYVGAVNGPRPLPAPVGAGFHNQRGATMVPASAMTSSRPIAAVAHPISAQGLASSRPLSGLHPVMPIATTAGVTPLTAQQLHLAPPNGTGIVHAPGPAIQPRPAATTVPVLRGPQPPVVPHVNTPVVPLPAGSTPSSPPNGRPVGSPPPVVPHPTVPVAPVPHFQQPQGPGQTAPPPPVVHPTPPVLPHVVTPGVPLPTVPTPGTPPNGRPIGSPPPIMPQPTVPVAPVQHFQQPQRQGQTALPPVVRPTPPVLPHVVAPGVPLPTVPTPRTPPNGRPIGSPPPIMPHPTAPVAPAQQFQQPRVPSQPALPPPVIHTAPPPPVVHTAPPPPPIVRSAPPPPPVIHAAPPPPPVFRPPPPPPPVFHPPPPPVVHAAPPPPPPVFHPPPPPPVVHPQPPPPPPHKKPGEP